MKLRLNYKIGDKTDKINYKYNITYNGQTSTVTYTELVDLINSTNSKDRNCKLIKNAIALKQGYGNLVTLKQEKQAKKKWYVEVVDLEKVSKYKCRFIEYCVVEFAKRDFKSYKPYYSLLGLEGVIAIDNWNIKTRFGITNCDNLSSGMKSLLVLYYMLDKEDNFIIDLSSCGNNYLKIAFRKIVESNKDVKVVIRHSEVSSIDTPIVSNNKQFSNGLRFMGYLLDKECGE
jgi:hypothetical protein